MVKEIIDEKITDKHRNYEEFLRWQYIADLDVGDKVEIKIEYMDYEIDDDGNKIELGMKEIKKEFIATNINCHINCQWQDKGVKNIDDEP